MVQQISCYADGSLNDASPSCSTLPIKNAHEPHQVDNPLWYSAPELVEYPKAPHRVKPMPPIKFQKATES